jgi:hypothetical protein
MSVESNQTVFRERCDQKREERQRERLLGERPVRPANYEQVRDLVAVKIDLQDSWPDHREAAAAVPTTR